jgi:hypothetical protein
MDEMGDELELGPRDHAPERLAAGVTGSEVGYPVALSGHLPLTLVAELRREI